MARDADETFDNDEELIEDSPEDKRRKRIRYLLLAVVVVALVCLVGALVFNILTGEPPDEIAADTPTPSAAPTEEDPGEAEDEGATPTPTRVVGDEPTSEPTDEPTSEATTELAPEPTGVTPTAATSTVTTRTTTITTFEPGPAGEVLKNGGFEEGFDNRGVGLHWDTFKNDGINVVYSGEGPGPYVESGSKAQRITTMQASLGDRYTGIYQQVDVVADETYTLNLQGQIRTGFGDVNQSSHGYRMQYAIGENGIRNWQVIPEENWVELPWDEQLLNSPDVKFLDYTTKIVPTSDEITLFVRTWNKWADPGEAQFTLDSLSLVGPAMVARTVEVVATVEQSASEASIAAEEAGPTPSAGPTTESEQAMVDNGLPVTGTGDEAGFPSDGRFWGALLILILLAIGAVYRAKWSH